MQGIEYYYNDEGEIGVLVSGGYGAGWSTWNGASGIKLALDKRIIEIFLKHEDDRDWLEQISSFDDNATKTDFQKKLAEWGYGDDIYLGGFADCYLEFVPKGSAIKINEYDGSESLEVGYTEFTILN